MVPNRDETERDQLTQYQQRLVREVDEICDVLGLDYWKMHEYEREARTPHLERIKRHLIIGEVVTRYTLVDEYLNMRLCDYFFGRGRSYIKLWKTKRFQHFNHHVLEQLSLLEKLAFVDSIRKVHKTAAEDIRRLNALRNGLAHAFFPENLKKSKPVWKGKSIFTVEAVRAFNQDMERIFHFFLGV